MISGPADALTVMNRALHVVDNATITAESAPEHIRGRNVAEVIDEKLHPSPRGAKRVGVTIRIWLALLISAAWLDAMTIENMYKIAVKLFDERTKWDLGIRTASPAGNGKVHELSKAQLYRISDSIYRHLDTSPELKLDDEEITLREAILSAATDALIEATHVLPHNWTSYAVDESGVWCWNKAPRRPRDLPMADPSDEDTVQDVIRAEEEQASRTRRGKVDPSVLAGGARPDEDAGAEPSEDCEPDEDFNDAEPGDDAKEAVGIDDEPAGSGDPDRHSRRFCFWARWGVKTHKSGRRSAFFGYALHVLLRVPDVIKGGGKPARTDSLAEPLLVEQAALTPASTDIVDVTLDMIDKTNARGHRVRDLIGDRHYSYKAFERWGRELFRRGVRQVLDLRKNDHKPISYEGSIFVAGKPHCGLPSHLWDKPRPEKGAPKEEFEEHLKVVKERDQYAMERKETPWGSDDDSLRSTCAPKCGKAGCPRVPGSVEVALQHGLPIITPPERMTPWCEQESARVPASKVLKYTQQETWGSESWLISWARRTYVEGLFGRMKNHHTGNIRRGFMCFTGRALVTLTMAAALTAYNLRELEDWYERATDAERRDPRRKHNPLLDLYAAHPLHKSTESLFGHIMLTAEQQARHDQTRLLAAETDARTVENSEETPAEEAA
jgi:hypothetical protein